MLRHSKRSLFQRLRRPRRQHHRRSTRNQGSRQRRHTYSNNNKSLALRTLNISNAVNHTSRSTNARTRAISRRSNRHRRQIKNTSNNGNIFTSGFTRSSTINNIVDRLRRITRRRQSNRFSRGKHSNSNHRIFYRKSLLIFFL